MIQDVIKSNRPDEALKEEELPDEWRAGPRTLSFDHFTAMLNEVNDSILRDENGDYIINESRESPIKRKRTKISKKTL